MEQVNTSECKHALWKAAALLVSRMAAITAHRARYAARDGLAILNGIRDLASLKLQPFTVPSKIYVLYAIVAMRWSAWREAGAGQPYQT